MRRVQQGLWSQTDLWAAKLALLLFAATAPAAAETGAQAFEADCASCHTLGAASTPDGPTLKGVVWRKIASLPDFPYSNALKGAVGDWSPRRLDGFLRNSQAFAPHEQMFSTMQDAARRRAIIDYLKTVK